MKKKTNKKKRITMSWSGGKDSALALFKILQDNQYEVVSLHTVIGKETKRVGLHGVREELIEQQANAIGIPLIKLYLETASDHEVYKKLMSNFYKECRSQLIVGVVFGDIFLEDLKKFREELLSVSGLFPVFPIWKQESAKLINDFLGAGFKTLICSANKKYFGRKQLGATIDENFIHSLSGQVDPCGENGEFHTFVYDGPLFQHAVEFLPGEVIARTYTYNKINEDNKTEEIKTTFWFQDLFPGSIDDKLLISAERHG